MEEEILEFRKAFVDTAKSSKRILLTTHMGPDDDAIGSILSVYSYLKDNLDINENNVRIRTIGKIRDGYKYFRYFDKVRSIENMSEEVVKADMIVLVDGNSWTRFMENIPETKAKTFLIDHHPRDHKTFDHEIVIPAKTSASEIIYDIFYKGNKIDSEVCKHLLAGILGDTGQLRFIDYKKSEVLEAVKDLIEQGKINVDTFLASYSKMSLDTFSLLKMIMSNATIRQIGDWPPYMISYLEEASLGRLMGNELLIREASHSFTKYLKEVEGADWGFIVTPRGEYSSISFRSMPNAPNVRLICEKMCIGGGHDRAAGARIETNDVKKAILMIEKWLSQNKPEY